MKTLFRTVYKYSCRIESYSTFDIAGAFQRSRVWMLATPSRMRRLVRKDLVSPAGLGHTSQRTARVSGCRAYSRERLRQLQLLYLEPNLEKRVVSLPQHKERHQKDTKNISGRRL
jgi:hypothetical protein